MFSSWRYFSYSWPTPLWMHIWEGNFHCSLQLLVEMTEITRASKIASVSPLCWNGKYFYLPQHSLLKKNAKHTRMKNIITMVGPSKRPTHIPVLLQGETTCRNRSLWGCLHKLTLALQGLYWSRINTLSREERTKIQYETGSDGNSPYLVVTCNIPSFL